MGSCIRALALCTLSALPAPALADLESFAEGAHVCLNFAAELPEMREIMWGLGWPEAAGASEREFEYARNESHFYLRVGAPAEIPGCTISDDIVTLEEARKFLFKYLARKYPGYVAGSGFSGEPVWRALVDEGTLIFSVQAAPGGVGAAISVELRP